MGLLLLQACLFVHLYLGSFTNTCSNFDCDPSKHKDSAGRGSGFMTDKGPGGGKDVSFTTTVGGNRINWFKSYGCMLYDDAPFEDKTTTGKAAEIMASIGMQDLGNVGQVSER